MMLRVIGLLFVLVAVAAAGRASTNESPKTNKPQKLTPFLMFTGQAEEAMKFYTSLFKDGEILQLERFGEGETGTKGTVKLGRFIVAGQQVMCTDSPPVHDFTFTPSTSFFVNCESEKELNELFAKLSKDGEVMMPPDNYGFSRKFAWLADRFGVSWQLNLPAEP